MNKITDILYNPGSIHTCGPSESMPSRGLVDKLAGDDYDLFYRLEEIVQGDLESKLESDLFAFHLALTEGVDSQISCLILREFNRFLSRAVGVYQHNTNILTHALHIVKEIKNQIDAQSKSFMGQDQWVELEKSIYFLSAWEEALPTAPDLNLFS